MASIHFFGGELDAAEKALARAEHLGRDQWSIAYHRGLIAERRGDVGAARVQFRKANELNPAHIASRAHLIGLEPIPAVESK
jgi:Flp pilus assembly protein TadD